MLATAPTAAFRIPEATSSLSLLVSVILDVDFAAPGTKDYNPKMHSD